MKKLSVSEIRDTLGQLFSWTKDRHWKGVSDGSISVELLELDDGRIGNIIIRVPTSIAIDSLAPTSQAALNWIAELFAAHGMQTSATESGIAEDMLTALNDQKTKSGDGNVGVSYKVLTTLGLIQIKMTYEQD